MNGVVKWGFLAGVVLSASVTRGDAACPFDEGDPGSIHAFAERLLVHRDPAVAAANRNRIFIALDRLEKLAVRGDFTNRVRYAEARETVGVLYGQTRFLTLARWTRERLRREFGDLPDLRYGTSDPAVLAHRKLLALNRTALATEQVEPGDATHPFWNVHARFFTYAPAFDFRPVPSAAAYRFRVYDRNQEVHEFTAETPFASLLPVWDAVPAGPTRVICYAVDAQGGILGIAGERDFRRLEPFYPNGYAPARRTYAEALARVNGFLRDWPELKEILATGKADLSHQTNIVNYPSKMLPWAIRMLIARGEIKEAKTVAEYLLSLREPAGAPLEHFTPTYVGDYFICRRYRGQTMMLYPAEGAGGFLDLYEACGEPRYLEAAEQTARTYLKLQRPDGTWSLKYELATGKVTSPNALMPNNVIDFLERLYGLTGKEEYRAAADRAFAFIERGPLADWNWEGQFEDIGPAESKYANLTKHYACDTAIYLLKRFPGDAKRLDQARRLLRFAEDQFVVWVRPCDGDGQGFGHLAYYPYNTWRCPVALEQYSCYQPIDASAAKLIRTYLALHAAEGNPLDLAKARALGDSMVNNQDDNGRIRTYWIPEAGDGDDPDAGAVRLPEGGDWFNCMSASAEALALLKAADGETASAAFTGTRPAAEDLSDVDGITPARMREIYETVRTPHKYGVVLEPEEGHMLDNPMVFRHGDAWYMLYVDFDGRGYETHLATSADLLSWKPLGRVFSRGKPGAWDSAQADGWPILLDPDWAGTNALRPFEGRYWMMYMGGEREGYETDPLSQGVAWTDDPSKPSEWVRVGDGPVLSPSDSDARAFERKTIYKSFVVEDPSRRLGGRFVSYYNAKQDGEWVERIGIATSDDLRRWKRFGDGPCVFNEGSLDHGICGDPMVRKIGDDYVMFFFGYNWDGGGKGGAFDTFAASRDLVHWTRWRGPHLVEPSEPWDRTHAHKPWVICHDGVVYHFYCAVGERGRALALATSRPVGRRAKVVPHMTLAAPGAVKPGGWLRDMACAIRDGYTAHMDEVDEQFRMAWAADTTPRGKDVHWWSNPGSWSCEGGAYWFDGLVRLAFQLDDPSLKTMISNRLETVLTRTSEKTFGFCWWMRPDRPQDVKDMKSDGFLLFNAEKLESTVGAWYEATGDPRAERALRLAFTQHVFDLMTEQRGAPLRGAVDAWRLTRDPALAARIDAACADKAAGGRLWTVYGRPPAKGLEETLNLKYRHERMLGIPSRHGIGAHSALARLLCAYRWTGDEELLKTVRAWYDFFGKHCRQPFGHTVMDEEWGHAGPTRATETCTAAIENATRLELLAALGEGAWGDDVELSVFNLVPNCFSSDFRAHVYMQQPNRTRDNDLADCSHGGDPDPQGRPHTHGRYERKHYPLCCTAGLNRLLPDYVQSMWLKTRDGGVAAALYGPSTFETDLPGGRFAVREETAYPFEETVRLVVDAAPQKAVPLYVRLPKWCAAPSVCINGKSMGVTDEKGFAKFVRIWRRGDVVTIRLPMKPAFHTMRDRNNFGRAYGWLTLGPVLFAQRLPSADANTPTNPDAVVPTISAARAERVDVTRLSSSVRWDRPDEPPVRLRLRTADGAPLELVPYGLSKFRFTVFPLQDGR